MTDHRPKLGVTEILTELNAMQPGWQYTGGQTRRYTNIFTGENISRRQALNAATTAIEGRRYASYYRTASKHSERYHDLTMRSLGLPESDYEQSLANLAKITGVVKGFFQHMRPALRYTPNALVRLGFWMVDINTEQKIFRFPPGSTWVVGADVYPRNVERFVSEQMQLAWMIGYAYITDVVLYVWRRS